MLRQFFGCLSILKIDPNKRVLLFITGKTHHLIILSVIGNYADRRMVLWV